MKEIVIASKNKGKVAEIEKAFQGLGLKAVSLAAFFDVPDAVEDGKTFLENALIKARFYAKATGQPCLADDSGLEVDALSGAPGVYSARYAGEHASDDDNNRRLLREIERVHGEGSAARFCCSLAFVDENGEALTCEACCEGSILAKPVGAGGFGYDPLFFVNEVNKSMAELTIEEKNKISHRGKALRIMTERLAGYFK